MIRKYTRLFSAFIAGICLLSFNVAKGQQIQNLSDRYYYNNFDGGAIGSALTQRGATPAFQISGQATNNLAATTGYCLSSVGNGTSGGLNVSMISAGTNLNDETYGFEWTFLYKNTGGNADNSDVMSNNKNAWKYWLLADGTDLALAKGYFITQVGTTFYLRYRYDNYPDGTHYNNLISFDASSIGGNNTTYAIRIQRLKRNGQYVWHMFIDAYSPTVKQGYTERGGTGAYNGDVNIYNNSALLCVSTTNGRFLFDEMKLYSMRLNISGANDTANGISNPLYAGQVGAIIYGLQIQTRGLFDMYQIRIENTGSITSILQSGTMKLMKSLDNFYGSADDTFITNLEFYDGAVQKYGFSDRFYSIGTNSGSNVTVCYYFITANVRADASLTNSYTFTGAPVLQSESAQINYVSNGDVVETTAPEAGSGIVYDWVGGIDYNWLKPENWSPLGQPGVKDVARIGVVTFTNQPKLSGTTNVGNVILGVVKAVTLTVDGTLNVTSTMTQKNAENADITTIIQGTGTINAANFIVGDRTEGTTVSGTANSTLVNLNVANTVLSDALVINSIYRTISSGFRANNSGVQLGSGKILTAAQVRSLNANVINTSSLYINGGTLKLTGATAFSSISEIGNTYIMTPSSGSSTIEYTSNSAQTIYPEGVYFGNSVFATASSSGYSSIKLSGTGVKTFASGTVNIKGSWESAGGKVDLSTNNTAVNFNGTTQTITDNGTDGGAGVFFSDVTFSGGGTKTLAGTGKFSVASGGTLNVAASTTLAAAGKLTLKSDADGFATVSALTTGSITGIVNDEIFFTGGVGKRGTRLISPSINDNQTPAGSKYLQQLQNNMVITGPGGEANGFDPGNNVSSEATTLNFYNEPATMASAADQYIKIPGLTNELVPVVKPGQGVFLFYRGDRSNYSAATAGNSIKLTTGYVPESFPSLFAGTLNQGSISTTITNTNNANDNYNGYNLVGNPYPATIDFEKLYADNSSNLANEIRIILPGGGMMSRKNVGGVVTVINAGDAQVSQYIQPGQGFYIRKTSVGTANLNFSETNKVGSDITPDRLLSAPASNNLVASLKMGVGNDAIMAGNNTPASQAISFYFNLKDSQNADETVIVFKDGFDANGDTNDAPYLSGSTVSLYSFSADNKPMAMNFMPDISNVHEVRISVSATASGPVSLNFTSTAALGRYKASLKDNYLNKLVDIKANPVYNFDIDRSVSATYGANRFVLVFEEGPALAINLAAFEAKQQESTVELNWTSATEESSVRFDVERSADGTTFTKIGEVAGAGNSSSPLTYSFIDRSPVIGTNYYRLQQVFSDETGSYSEIKSVNYIKPIQINLEVFTAQQANTVVDLKWTTITEESSVRFEIERSADGITFTKIGEKPGADNSSVAVSYAFTDSDPLVGLNNYRLKQIYSNGTFSYSEIRSLIFNRPVPVNLASFTAAQQNATIALNWTTASETESSKFIVERSADGTNFTTVGELDAAGNSSAQVAYSLTDNAPLTGTNQYRLKLVYENGTYAYSEIRTVNYVVPVKVDLITLGAIQQGTAIALSWSTSAEEGTVRFEVEHSSNGVSFTKTAEIAAAGQSSVTRNYNATDNTPFEGQNYYRLKYIFNNSTYAYSAVETATYTEPAVINITTFTVTRQGARVAIDFTTAAEKNSARFEIERSSDGTNFTKIGEVAAAGNSTLATGYNFIDEQPLKGNNYYRIKQVNINGQFAYSDQKQINFFYNVTTGIVALTVYPNPSSESIEVNVGNVATKLTIYSLAGKPVKTATFAAGEPVKQRISDLTVGMYIVELKNTQNNTIVGTAKFFKN